MTATAAERQIAAADPLRSTWLTANAGSGKTRVLTDRVARLLLAGVKPQNILCLTYTKAAAGEMQNRLFRGLGSWAMKPDVELAKTLTSIGVEDVELSRARRLFAGAIETPGGLKIQTIHSFCAAILRQFPLEARVSPRFREIDERETKLMLRALFDSFAEGPEAASLDAIAPYCPQGEVESFLQDVVAHASTFARPVSPAEIAGWFGLAPDETVDTVTDEALSDWDQTSLKEAATLWSQGSSTDTKKADSIAAFFAATTPRDRVAALAATVLTAKGEPYKALATKATLAKAPELFEELTERAADLPVRMLRISAAEEARRTSDLWRFGRQYCAGYAKAKLAAGVLDFDDLINKTLALLSDPGVAEWVLYRLDGGIDHILVDEAQDTSPEQWAIIEKLAQEFSSGIGARAGVPRTIFAVGDPKQSIYSFQGADPREFARMKELFGLRLAGSDTPLQERALLHSFRSSPAILQLVDRIFGQGSPGVGGSTEHLAFRPDQPGRVDLWALIPKPEKPEPPPWHDARERISPERETRDLARRLALEIARMIAEEALPDGSGGMRALWPGDILILVRRRSFISDALISELKRANLPVAGADQIALAQDLAVMDVVAVLKFLDQPGDDLSLASALRSPIFGFGEGDLFRLASNRGDLALWDRLRINREDHTEALTILEDLLSNADFLRPFELIERLLIRHRGRERMIARLGAEVEEALDILLDQALAFESAAVPSLTGFLAWHEIDGTTVKRQLDSSSDAIRVMTVHGSKGLESPVVVMPDTADRKPPTGRVLFTLPDGMPIFRPNAARRPPALETAFTTAEKAREDEEDRLFYVALTRPRNWLIVCGAGEAQNDERPAWHSQVRTALADLGATPLGREGLRLSHGEWGSRPTDRPVEAPAPIAIPDWAITTAPTAPERERLVAPSTLGLGPMPVKMAEALAEDAALRGRLLHLLLEHLPAADPEERAQLAVLLLSQQDEPIGEDLIAEITAEALAVLAAPDLAPLFTAEALTEVDVTAALPEIGGRRMLGRIDRLIRRPGDGLLVIDYKSHANVPDRPEEVPTEILVQMGCYASALAQIFPDLPVELAVLWTRSAKLMTLPYDMVTEALAKATTS